MNEPAADPKQSHVAREFAAPAPLINCRFDPAGTFVFAALEDRSVVRWKLEDGSQAVFQGHDSWVRPMVFTPDGQTLITGGYDDTLIWWPAGADKPEPIRKVQAHKGWIRAAAVSPDGKLLVTGGNDRLVKLWSVEDGSALGEWSGHELDVYSVAFHPQGQYVLSGDLLGKVHQWEVSSGKLVGTFDASALHTYNSGQQVHYGGVRSISFSPDLQHVACSGLHKASNPLGAVNEPLVLRFQWESRKLLKSHVADKVQGIAWRAVFHPSGLLLAASGGSGGGFLLFWNADEEKCFHQMKLPNTAREMDLHPDGIQIATAHYDRKLRITRMAAKAA